jgi:hypothetical protein
MDSDRNTLAGGLPHSDIHGSKPARGSPWLFAACHVLHRLLVPRHPPNALVSLDNLPPCTGTMASCQRSAVSGQEKVPHGQSIERTTRHALPSSQRTRTAKTTPLNAGVLHTCRRSLDAGSKTRAGQNAITPIVPKPARHAPDTGHGRPASKRRAQGRTRT